MPLDDTDACVACGYDLSGLLIITACPECGECRPRARRRAPVSRAADLSARCHSWILLILAAANMGLARVPRYIYVGGYPNGANPNSWWWSVTGDIRFLSFAAGIGGLLTLGFTWHRALRRTRWLLLASIAFLAMTLQLK